MDDRFELEEATEIASGTTLLTKDGRKTGNAIVLYRTFVIGRNPDEEHWVLESDFGNVFTLSEKEILDWFHLGYVGSADSWWARRMRNIIKTAARDG